MFNIDYSKGEINRGNYAPIAQVFERAQKGGRIKVGFLGGSITQGSLASTPETCYAYRVYKWWKDTFKDADVEYINAGIGATSSQYGVARVDKDLLSYEPDFILIEFAVNDGNDAFFRETYEGLIRRSLHNSKQPAILLMTNVRYDDCTSAEDMHLQIAKHYGLPMVSMKSTILPEILNGNIANRDITPDDLHPNDAGHELVANVIIAELEKIKTESESEISGTSANEIRLPEPLTLNGYENSVIYQSDNSNPVLGGFIKDTSPKEGMLDLFKNGWIATHAGDKIIFELNGTGFSVQYRKSVNQPAPIAEVIVDNDLSTKKMLNANFDEDWGDYLCLDTVTKHMQQGLHKIEITITEAHEDDVVPFYLVSVIGSDVTM